MQSSTKTSRTLCNLSALVQTMLDDLPCGKPWQRQLRVHLVRADRKALILRMTMALNRGPSEVLQAAKELQVSLSTANASVANGRTDAGTKALVGIACAASRGVGNALEV